MSSPLPFLLSARAPHPSRVPHPRRVFVFAPRVGGNSPFTRVPHPRDAFVFVARVGNEISLAALALGVAFLASHSVLAQADSQWVAGQSTLTYHMSHPMHEVDGASHAARGKGVCHAGQCDFLMAVPVKSFDSGDTNRDLHMIEATHGAEYPMIVVRAHFAQAETAQPWIHADLEVQFAGQTAHYAQVPFQRSDQGKEVRITGTIPLTCSDFKIDRPSFLTVPIKNEIPVRVDMLWHAQG
jgi:hypothetical protein